MGVTKAVDLARETQAVLDCVLNRARTLTEGGRAIDDHQVITRRIAGLATRVEAADALDAYARWIEETEDTTAGWVRVVAELNRAQVALEVRQAVETLTPDAVDDVLGMPLFARESLDAMRDALDEANYRAVGRVLVERGAENDRPIGEGGEDAADLQSVARRFARERVAPEAEAIHREDRLVSEDLIGGMAELGFFGMSVPEAYGGVGMTNLMMVVATEELSAVSLPAAGSLITRPEILAKALLDGGTEAQKQAWLPHVASGAVMVAVAVTEPNVGSDVASLTCRATPATVDGRDGYLINGSKAWCTFAGRADVLALLARTDPDPDLGHKGLSLFIVEKTPSREKQFVCTQPTGGRLEGKADPTIGYRGMHSFTMQFQDYFVPAGNLIGGSAGRGRGFYLQMGGFATGRLQTGGRATGLAQASLAAAVRYARERPQFGEPIAEYQSTRYELGRMAVQLEAARQLTYAAARAMDAGSDRATLLAAMAKLLSCRVAVDVSQRAQLLHGGWGYAEEYPISRYVCDALVLPIFEGVEPILEMKVIGRTLLSG